jgi:3',5'-cyclic AMP phosphodiesterase CpdA
VSLIAHLSDLHLFAAAAEETAIFKSLVEALRAETAARGRRMDLIVITGDVFDSVTVEPALATHRFAELLVAFQEASGGSTPTVIIPGNHDRRRSGLIGPHREELFLALRDKLGPSAWVHGCTTPVLSAVIPHEVHGQPLWIVAYDSTYLPRGLLSAGGALRQEDLLYAAAQIGDQEPDWPVLFLLHHHLVPTPLTDLDTIDLRKTSALVRWGITRLLPELVANADREELTMTALGAGTAISTLHTLGRAVLVLHGHKHYATARLLDGVAKGEGDVLIVSAGSAGMAQTWYPTSARDAARLWPSFNVIDLTSDRVSVDTLSFGWKSGQQTRHFRRPLVAAQRNRAQWLLEHIEHDEFARLGPLLSVNEAHFNLTHSPSHAAARWDYTVERRVALLPKARLRRYVETVDALHGATLHVEGADRTEDLPAQVRLNLRGVVRYRVEAAISRTQREARRCLGDRASPFASVSLMNRYGSSSTRLVVTGIGEAVADGFASATDLGTGLERPLRVVRSDGSITLEQRDCPPRTLLRVYWRLAP